MISFQKKGSVPIDRSGRRAREKFAIPSLNGVTTKSSVEIKIIEKNIKFFVVKVLAKALLKVLVRYQ